MRKLRSLLIAIAGLSLSLGAAIGVGLSNEKKQVEKAEAATSATYYYVNCDDSIWSGWGGFSYNKIGVKYWDGSGDHWDWNEDSPDTEKNHLKTVIINGKTYKRWTYQSCTGFLFYAFDSGPAQNTTGALSPQDNGNNVYIVNSNNASSNQTGDWKYYCENRTASNTYYLDATNWDIDHSSSDYVALFYYDDISGTADFVEATRLNLDSKKSFYSATMTGNFNFVWCNKNGESWLKQTADLNVMQYPKTTKNLCIASSTNKAAGKWLLTDGTIKTFTFYEYKNSASELIGTYYLFDGDSFGLGGVPLPSEEYGYSGSTVWHEGSYNGTSRSSDYVINPVHSDYSFYAVRQAIVVSFVGEDGNTYPDSVNLEFEYDNTTKQYAGLITVADTSKKMRIKKVTGNDTSYFNTLEDGVAVASTSGDFIQFSATGTYSVYFKVESGAMWIQAASARNESYMFAKYFLHNVGCDDDGVNAPSGWTTVATRYSTLSNDAKDDIYSINIVLLDEGDAIKDMIECYNWALSHNPHSDSMEHFIKDHSGNERAVPNARIINHVAPVSTSGNDNITMITIVGISAVSLLAVGGYFFIRKRKEF